MLEHPRKISLDGEWDFTPGHLKCENIYAHLYGHPEIEWQPIQVPYCWNGSRWMSVVGEYYYQNGYYKDGAVPPFKDHLGVGWYRKKVNLPQEWLGQRVHLRFLAVAAKAKVWVNANLAGEHLGAYSAFEFDITPHLDFSRENTIVVQVWGKHCFYPHDERRFDQGGIHMFVPGRTLEIPVGETRDNAGIWQPVEIYATGQAYLRDFDVTTTLDSLKLTATVIRTYGDPRMLAVKARLVEPGSGRVVREELKHTRLPEETTVLTYRWNNLDVKPWSPEAPNLYRLEVELEDERASMGMAAKEIGFKVFEIRDRKFYLNGRPYFLRGAGSPPAPLIAHDEEYIAKFLGMCKDLNLNCIRYHTEPPSQAWLRGCDRFGLLAIFEGPLMQQAPEIVNTKREYRDLVRQAKHHPCLAIYCLSNESEFLPEMGKMTGYDSMAHYLEDLREAVLEADASLPVYHNAGYSLEVEGGEIRDWHIYGGWYDNCIYSFEAIVKGQAMMEALSPDEGQPMQPGGLKDRRNSKFWRDMHKPVILTEFLAAYTADDGHLYQYPLRVRRIGRYPDEENRRALWFQAFLLKEIVEILRRSRDETNNLSGVSPFALFNWFFHPLSKEKISPKPAAQALKEVMEPAHASIKCWHRHVFGGDPLKAEAYLINDDAARGDIHGSALSYAVKDGQGRVLAEGQAPIDRVGYYEIKVLPLELVLPDPAGDRISEADLELEWRVGNEVLSHNALRILVAPSALRHPRPDRYRKRVCLFDPEGRTAALLTRMGVPFRNVAEMPAALGAEEAVVVGSGALSRLTERDKSALNRFAKEGGRILVLEQDVYHIDRQAIEIDWIDNTPLRILREDDQIDDFVYVADWSQPIFAGLAPEHFRMWNGNTVVISSYIRQGTEENHVPAKTLFGARSGYGVRKLEHVRTYVECFNFLKNDGLVEVPLGKGAVLLSQLEATRRYGDDPVATVYLNNLLGYVLR
ncbi:MAG: sugar-binding domain-containing protein [Bacteroidota bacterium]